MLKDVFNEDVPELPDLQDKWPERVRCGLLPRLREEYERRAYDREASLFAKRRARQALDYARCQESGYWWTSQSTKQPSDVLDDTIGELERNCALWAPAANGQRQLFDQLCQHLVQLDLAPHAEIAVIEILRETLGPFQNLRRI